MHTERLVMMAAELHPPYLIASACCQSNYFQGDWNMLIFFQKKNKKQKQTCSQGLLMVKCLLMFILNPLSEVYVSFVQMHPTWLYHTSIYSRSGSRHACRQRYHDVVRSLLLCGRERALCLPGWQHNWRGSSLKQSLSWPMTAETVYRRRSCQWTPVKRNVLQSTHEVYVVILEPAAIVDRSRKKTQKQSCGDIFESSAHELYRVY